VFILNPYRFAGASWANTLSTDFDGVDEYAKASGSTIHEINATNFSLSAWIKMDDTIGTQQILGKGTIGGGHEGYSIYCLGATFGSQLRDTTNTVTTAGGDTTISTATWYHVVVTVDWASSTGHKLYIDGTAESTTASTIPLNGDLRGTSIFSIGAKFLSSGSLFANCNVDEVTFWSTDLSAAEVTELYNSGTPEDPTTHSQDANLVAIYRMGDGDTHPTISDNEASADLTLINSESGDFVSDVP